MANALIIIVIVLIMSLGIRESVKHFKGEGDCCGGGSTVKAEKKKLEGKVIGTYTLHIEGMHCQNCVNAVTNAINDIEGASAKVSLRNKTAEVSYDREIDKDKIIEAITKKGYVVQQ